METKIKERPILFSGPMVQALLAGTKTQTRRMVKCPAKHLEDIWQDGQGHFDIQPAYNKPGYEMWDWEYDSCRQTPLVCPYGQPGDRLWVRETWQKKWVQDGFEGISPKNVIDGVDLGSSPQYIKFKHDGYHYAADETGRNGWKPSIHMPRAASRLLLELTSVRCERLQGISEADAVAEGIEVQRLDFAGRPTYKHYYAEDLEDEALGLVSPVNSYRTLWQKINGLDSWAANPWVWVVEFKVVESTVAPIKQEGAPQS